MAATKKKNETSTWKIEQDNKYGDHLTMHGESAEAQWKELKCDKNVEMWF